jgi:hypothetical protein
MRYRTLDANGDYVLGRGPQEFLVDSPAAVAQAVLTSLLLHQGEWFLDVTAGMPWETQVLGFGTGSLYDAAIKTLILGVQGVASIVQYFSSLNRAKRILTVTATINTIFGNTAITVNFTGFRGYGQGPFGQIPFGSGG